jgi:hypothetical protein
MGGKMAVVYPESKNKYPVFSAMICSGIDIKNKCLVFEAVISKQIIEY